MKILLLGANGQVGWELRRSLALAGEVIALARQPNSDGLAVDVADLSQLDQLIRAIRPTVIVNAAAYTAVDQAEREPDLAHCVNALAPGVMARAAADLDAGLIHYSTDYVFDGSGSTARPETAPTGPLSVYGSSKLAGEEAIRDSGCRHLIFRTSWVHATRGGNFARTMLRLAAQRDALNVVNDQIGAPTGADLLADLAAQALPKWMANRELGGTYHACAGGEVSWCEYAQHVIAWGHAAGLKLLATPDRVNGIPSSDYPTPAKRPLNSRLDCSRLQRNLGVHLPEWQAGVDRMLTEALPSLNLPHS